MGWLEGQVAIVTGGGSGIGLAVVERFVAEGARIGVLERSATRVAELQQHFGDDIVVCAGDVTRLDDNARIVAMTRERFGRLDAFIGNAGIWDYMVGLEKQPADRLEAICDAVSREAHPLLGVAKDTGSAAVLLSLVLCALTWMVLLTG